MNIIYIRCKFKNDLTFIYEDMGPFICAHLSVLLSVRSLEINILLLCVLYSEIHTKITFSCLFNS